MNDTINLMQSHRSSRSYSSEPVSDALLDEIIKAAQCGPSSMNGQQTSLVVVRDAAKRARIAELAGDQPWIAQAPVFIAIMTDFYKTSLGVAHAGQKQIIHESVEGYTVGAIDAGITLGNLMTAARSFGLGIVPIGGIRRNPQAMIDLLELPPYTFPLVGLCIGHIAQQAPQKPRLAMASYRHDEHYRRDGLPGLINDYDATMVKYWQEIERTDGVSWSANLANSFTRVYFPEVKPVAAKQGFLNGK